RRARRNQGAGPKIPGSRSCSLLYRLRRKRTVGRGGRGARKREMKDRPSSAGRNRAPARLLPVRASRSSLRVQIAVGSNVFRVLVPYSSRYVWAREPPLMPILQVLRRDGHKLCKTVASEANASAQ